MPEGGLVRDLLLRRRGLGGGIEDLPALVERGPEGQAHLEARAAGLPYVLDGAWSGIQDLDGLRAECTISRRIGYDGRTLIHPKHIAIAREIYEPDPDEVAYYTRLLAAFEDAERQGLAAITFEGKLVDYAMYKKARLFLGA